MSDNIFKFNRPKYKFKEYGSGFKLENKVLTTETSFGIVCRRRRDIIRNYGRVLKNGKSLSMGDYLKFIFNKHYEYNPLTELRG